VVLAVALGGAAEFYSLQLPRRKSGSRRRLCGHALAPDPHG
jgi:hypothetical protein